jgi:predicted aspartyl protease
MYAEGKGVPLNDKEAIKWYRLAAAQGEAAGEFGLGVMYVFGRGVPQDYQRAIKWYRLAAAHGNVRAQYNLGSLYLDGRGVPQDYAEAAKWFRFAAQEGLADAQYNIGLMYRNGEGVQLDYKEAIRWFRLAAAQGNAPAQFNLGEMYAAGQGVPEDNIRSRMWSALSNANGYADAAALMRDLTAKMTPAEIERSLDMAKRCQESNYEYCGELATSVPMQREGGVYVVPVLINNAITLNFIIDSGAADVSIPADVVMTLVRTGTLMESDFLGEKTYVLADGSKIPSATFRIRSLKVGNKVLEDVTGSVATVQGSLLLGQSFLGRFKSWSVDNTKHALVFE